MYVVLEPESRVINTIHETLETWSPLRLYGLREWGEMKVLSDGMVFQRPIETFLKGKIGMERKTSISTFVVSLVFVVAIISVTTFDSVLFVSRRNFIHQIF